MLNKFVLSKSQAKFLQKEKRKDPITGDEFVPGDEVVFCAGCRSAFHAGSWNYLGNSHCGQEETLTEFPDNKVSVKIKRDPTVFEGKKALNVVEPNPTPLIFIAAAIKVPVFLGIISAVGNLEAIIAGGTGSLFLLYAAYWARHKFKRTFLFFDDKIIVRKGLLKQNHVECQRVFNFEDIRSVRLEYRETNDEDNELKILFKNGKTAKVNLQYTEIDEIEKALLETDLNLRIVLKSAIPGQDKDITDRITKPELLEGREM